MAEKLFRMEGICKSFPGVKLLDDVSLSVNKGEVHGLVGENGGGKSTLMKIMTGVYRADAGDIYIQGEKVTIDSVAKAHEPGISIIFQEMTLRRHMTVAGNIFIGRSARKGPFVNDRQMRRDPESRGHRRYGGGQCQRGFPGSEGYRRPVRTRTKTRPKSTAGIPLPWGGMPAGFYAMRNAFVARQPAYGFWREPSGERISIQGVT